MVSIMIALHLLGAVVWVGGMFFAHMALRMAVAETLEPPLRLTLLRKVLGNFFPWVWVSIGLILLTGYGLLLGSLHGVGGAYMHIMQTVGWVMAALFCYLFFVPYKALINGVNEGDFPAAGVAMARIRMLIGVNLILGLFTILVGTSKLF